ncbi:MAG: DEAD/DEAH box helicase, partial [Spirochaetales bacterium]|nr:DEAD/DEAH box helicase [Spirochaetales bacterium]
MPNLPHFAELGLSPITLAALEQKGFEEPTEIQKAAIPLLLQEKKDVIGQAQTGTGKTAAFALPILEEIDPNLYKPQALILTPTRELAIQVAEETASLKGPRKLEIAPIYGGASIDQQLRRLKRGVQIVVGTPGRIMDHLERKTLDLSNLQFVVLDEADEMLDMGFIEDIETILSQTPSDKRMLLFSATMPKQIQSLAERFMHKDYEVIRIAQKQEDIPLTDQIYFEVREGDKLEALSRIIDMEPEFYGVVFCRTKIQCDEIGKKLCDRGYDAEALHGDLSQKQRELILNKMRNHQTSILVATDVAARGIDIQDLTHVINYSIPQDPEVYIHRIGRTGRAGKEGTAITFITPSEARKFSFIKRASKSEIRKESVPNPEQVVEAKRENLLKEIEESLAETNDTEYVAIAESLLEKTEAKEIIASLLSHFYKGKLDVSKYRDINQRDNRYDRDSRSDRFDRNDRRDDRFRDRGRERYDKVKSINIDDSGFTRLFIARGRNDGLTKRTLANIIIERANVRDEDLQNITVMEEFSFVNAPFQIAEYILKTFSE